MKKKSLEPYTLQVKSRVFQEIFQNSKKYQEHFFPKISDSTIFKDFVVTPLIRVNTIAKTNIFKSIKLPWHRKANLNNDDNSKTAQ